MIAKIAGIDDLGVALNSIITPGNSAILAIV